jgi:hypothetical protein
MFSPSFLPSFLFLYIHYNPGRANFCGPLDRSLLALIVAQAEPHRFCGPQDTYPGRGRGFAQVLTQFAAQSNFYCCEYPLSPDLTNDADRDHLVASNPSQAVQSRAEQSRAEQGSQAPHTRSRDGAKVEESLSKLWLPQSYNCRRPPESHHRKRSKNKGFHRIIHFIRYYLSFVSLF